MSETLTNSSAVQNEEIPLKSDLVKNRQTDSTAHKTDLTEDTPIKTEDGSVGIETEHAQEGDIEPGDQATAHTDENTTGSKTDSTQDDGTNDLRADNIQEDDTTS
ncbi:MAG: hypothetical protein ACJ788_16485, partial [Ktedonobacteraceae bacterium]